MPDREKALAETLAGRALAAAKAPEVEVQISGGRDALTRFAGGTIHQNLARSSLEVSIRVAENGRTGRAATTRTDEPSLRETADRAIAIAHRLESRSDLLPVPEPFPAYPRTRCWDTATSSATPETRARGVLTALEEARSRGFSAAGSFTTEDRFEAIANSRGLFAFGEYTAASFSTTMTAPDSTGYAESCDSAVGRIDIAAAALRAAQKAALSAAPGEVPPGEYTVILEPAAVGELLFYLLFGHGFSHFSGLAVLEGQSWFATRMEQKVFGENITLRDDLSYEGHWALPFDAEGVPRRQLVLIDRGVARAVTWDRHSARRAGTEPTGHGMPVPNTFGSYPTNLVLEGGATSLEEMIASTPRGILVTRLWYNRLVDPADLIVTGLTRDGTFLIEEGRIVRGLRNFRFNQSLRAMLNAVTALSPPSHAAQGIMAPALRVEGFRFAAVVPRES